MSKIFIFILFTSIIFYSCSESSKKNNQLPLVDSTSIKDSLKALQETVPQIRIINYKLIKSKSYQALVSEYDTLGANILLELNRVDKNRVRRIDSLVVPDTILTDPNIYSPFPSRIELLQKVKKILIISQTHQAFAAYEFGKLVRWGATSTGKRSTPTPNVLFHTNWKSKKTISTINEEWILKWYFNLDNFEGVSIHEYELPGYPASHSCARLLSEDAKWIYYWAEQWILTADGEQIIAYGTPVIIYGKYNFKSLPLWKLLPTEPDSTKISEEELTSVLQEHIFTILKRQEERDKILTEREQKLVSAKE